MEKMFSLMSINDTTFPPDVCSIYESISTNFKKCTKGFHLINTSVINEAIWEELNVLILSSSGINVFTKSSGSHTSGMDINCSIGKISNKSSKYDRYRKKFDISSYRLSGVCDKKHNGDIREIITEINKRKNFDYYSIIVRDTSDKYMVHYDWLLIPSTYTSLDPSTYEWSPLIGKQGKNKSIQIGWQTNEICGCKMSITFSMSSQLWIKISSDNTKQFIISSVDVPNKPVLNYINLLDKLL